MLGILLWFFKFCMKLGIGFLGLRNVLGLAASPNNPKKKDFVATPAIVWFLRLGPPPP